MARTARVEATVNAGAELGGGLGFAVSFETAEEVRLCLRETGEADRGEDGGEGMGSPPISSWLWS